MSGRLLKILPALLVTGAIALFNRQIAPAASSLLPVSTNVTLMVTPDGLLLKPMNFIDRNALARTNWVTTQVTANGVSVSNSLYSLVSTNGAAPLRAGTNTVVYTQNGTNVVSAQVGPTQLAAVSNTLYSISSTNAGAPLIAGTNAVVYTQSGTNVVNAEVGAADLLSLYPRSNPSNYTAFGQVADVGNQFEFPDSDGNVLAAIKTTGEIVGNGIGLTNISDIFTVSFNTNTLMLDIVGRVTFDTNTLTLSFP